MDATGNQCSDAATIVENVSEIALLRPTAKMSGSEQSMVNPAVTPLPLKMFPASTKSNVLPQAASRFAEAVPAPTVPVKTSKIETVDASLCSGGADGGMDATGNQCSENSGAGTDSTAILAAKR